MLAERRQEQLFLEEHAVEGVEVPHFVEVTELFQIGGKPGDKLEPHLTEQGQVLPDTMQRAGTIIISERDRQPLHAAVSFRAVNCSKAMSRAILPWLMSGRSGTGPKLMYDGFVFKVSGLSRPGVHSSGKMVFEAETASRFSPQFLLTAGIHLADKSAGHARLRSAALFRPKLFL
ncbi:MAG: hypothetical protein U1F71_11580 [Verrucomicrobiaceae bacterium]